MKFPTHKFGYYAIIGSIVGIVGLFGMFSLANINLIFYELASSLQGGTFPVSFVGGGNNYAGALIFKNQTSVNQTINFQGGVSVTCEKQIHGYYFNVARGVGLLPLSIKTQTNDGVTVTGGLYTACSDDVSLGDARLFDVVGMLTYQKNGASLGQVVFGVQTDEDTNTSTGVYLPGAVNSKPIIGIYTLRGKFFDTMLGIGEITSNVINTATIGSIGNLIGNFNIYIQGNLGLGKSVEGSEKKMLSISSIGTKTLLTSADEVTSSDVLNTVSRNTAKKCRATTIYTASDAYNFDIGGNKFVCIDLEGETFMLGFSEFNNAIKNKDVIFLNGNVKILNSIYKSTNYNNYLSIYIPDGNLIFDSYITPASLTDIDNNGFPTNGSNTAITKGVYLVGNFIVNGLIVGSEIGTTSYMTIPFKTIIHGKIVSLNTFGTVSEQRGKLLGNLLNTRTHTPSYSTLTTPGSNSYFPDGKWNASMGDVFTWKCADINSGSQLQGYGATPIGFDTNTNTAVEDIACPAGHTYPLMIIEKLLPSSFFLK